MTKIRLEEELIQKKDLVSKINTLQVELDRKVTGQKSEFEFSLTYLINLI